jgi:CheY-like chemotaxis protein
VAEELVGEAQRGLRVAREPTDARGLGRGQAAVEHGAERGAIETEEGTSSRGTDAAPSSCDFDRDRRGLVDGEVDGAVREVAAGFDGARNVEQTDHGAGDERAEGVLDALGAVAREVHVDEGPIDGVVGFHLEGHLRHLVALGPEQREEAAAGGLVVRYQVAHLEPRLGVRLGLQRDPVHVAGDAALSIEDEPATPFVEQPPLPQPLRTIEPPGPSGRGPVVRSEDARPVRAGRGANGAGGEEGIGPRLGDRPRVEHEELGGRRGDIAVAGVKPLAEREEDREGVAARVGLVMQLVEERAREGLTSSLRRDPDARDRACAHLPAAEPDLELEEEGLSEEEPAALEHVEAVETAEVVVREEPPPRLDAARIGEGAQVDLDQPIEVPRLGGSDREQAVQRTPRGYTKMAQSGVVVVGPRASGGAGSKDEMANEEPENRDSALKEPGSSVEGVAGEKPGRGVGGARADFVAGIGRKLADLRTALSALEADPRAAGPRDELRRKLHALGSAARLLRLDAMAASISDAGSVLEKGSRSGALGVAELGVVARALDDLPALAWGEASPTAGPTEGGRVETSLASLPSAGVSALVVGSAAIADALTEGTDGGESIFECERTEHTQAALGLARALAPDVVLVDSELRGALDLVEALLDDPLTEPVPIIVLGVFTSPEQAARFVALGVAKTLAKPVAPGTLRRACHDVIDQREGRTLPMTLGEPTLEQLGDRLAEEMKRALVESVDRAARSCRVPLGEGAEVVGALWGAIARVREIVTLRTNGAVRYTGGGPEGAVAMAPWLHPDVAGSDRLAAPERGRGAATEVSLDRRVVVVADDDPGVTWFISDLLRTTGCVVHEALDGSQALKLVYELSPELVVSDILMPGMDGFALCRALRRDVALRDTPVILLSWKEDLLQRVRELGASAAAYLRKESDARAIVARVREVLRPRARVEARLRASGEVRGRLDGLTVHSLLRLASAIRPSSRILVRDASFLYEVDLLGGAPRRATRTSTDGSFHHGPRVLAALLGVGAGRFVVTSLPADVRSDADVELEGTLAAQLARPTTRARAALAATTGANTMGVRRIVIDDEMVTGYLHATPDPTRALVRRIAAGESPRDILLRGEVSPSILEDVLADLAARGAVVAVQGDGGQDLLQLEALPRSGGGADKERSSAAGRTPSPLPASELVARELPVVRDAASRRMKVAVPAGSDAPPPSRPSASQASPSSLEDAVMRAMSDSPSRPPPSSEQPPIIEPSELRPRSSNPPAEANARGLASLPPDAIVPGASSGEIPAAPDASKTEPMRVAPEMTAEPRDPSIPIHVETSRSLGAGSRVAASKPQGTGEAKGSSWGVVVAVVAAFALIVVGGMRWLSSEPSEDAASGGAITDPDVTYGDLPPNVTVADGEGLLEVGVPAGEPVRIDGAEASPAPASGTLRRALTAGTHMVHAGPQGAERSRVVQVRAGRMARVSLDGP